MRMPLPQQFDSHDWSRWPQQQPTDYTIMSTPPLMPFDSPSTTTGPESKHMVTQALGPPYLVHSHYHPGPSYDAPSRPSQYQQPLPFHSYGQYPTPSPTAPLTPPFKSQGQHRSDMRLMSPMDGRPYAQHQNLPAQYHELTSSPMIKTDSYQSHPPALSPEGLAGPQKDVNPIVPDDPTKQIEFDTPIDNLMRKYQRFGGSQSSSSPPQLPTPAQSPRHAGGRTLPARNRKTKDRVFACSKCNYVSSQKAHLRAHHRTHTSELPWECGYCGKKCSQKGNLDVHIRAHKGERVFKCDYPGCESAGFFSKSNLAAHKKTHSDGRTKWVCKFPDCNKSFSSTGNRKAHQNKFHKKEFERLMVLIDNYEKTGQCPEEDKFLVEELAMIYKNSNKGIKGRGKGVKVEKIPKPATNLPHPMSLGQRTNPISDYRPMAVGSVSQMLAPVCHKSDGPMVGMYHHGRNY